MVVGENESDTVLEFDADLLTGLTVVEHTEDVVNGGQSVEDDYFLEHIRIVFDRVLVDDLQCFV